jgi:hypothetical protein
VRKAFSHWQLGPVSLLDLAVPLLLSMALVRAAIYVLRHAFSPSSWLATSERFIATSIWLGLALYLTGLAEPLIEIARTGELPRRQAEARPVDAVDGLVTVVSPSWSHSGSRARSRRACWPARRSTPIMRVVLGRLVKAVLSVIALLLACRSSASTSPRCRCSAVRSPSASDSVCRRSPATTSVASSSCSTARFASATWWRSTRDLRRRHPDHRPLHGPAHADRHRGDHPQRVPGVEHRAQ